MGRTLIDTWGDTEEAEEEEGEFELVERRPVPRGQMRRPMIQQFPAAADRDWGGTVVQYPTTVQERPPTTFLETPPRGIEREWEIPRFAEPRGRLDVSPARPDFGVERRGFDAPRSDLNEILRATGVGRDLDVDRDETTAGAAGDEEEETEEDAGRHDLLARSPAAIGNALRTIRDAGRLQDLLQREEAGRDREPVKHLIRARIDELDLWDELEARVPVVSEVETVLVGPRRARPTAPAGTQQRYLDRLLDVIPIEIITAWVFIAAIADAAADLPLTLYFGLFAFVTVIAGATIFKTATTAAHSQAGRDPAKTRADQYGQAMLAMVAFAIWVYYLQGPFGRWDGYISALGPILLALFAISSPFLPRLASRAVYRVLTRRNRGSSEDDEDDTGRSDPETALVLSEIRGAVGADEDPITEYVSFANSSRAPLDISGWTVQDDSGHVYEIPDGVEIDPEGTLTLVTGAGEDDRDPANVRLHWSASRPVWNDDSDVVSVRDSDGREVLRVAYGPRQ